MSHLYAAGKRDFARDAGGNQRRAAAGVASRVLPSALTLPTARRLGGRPGRAVGLPDRGSPPVPALRRLLARDAVRLPCLPRVPIGGRRNASLPTSHRHISARLRFPSGTRKQYVCRRCASLSGLGNYQCCASQITSSAMYIYYDMRGLHEAYRACFSRRRRSVRIRAFLFHLRLEAG